MYFESKYHQLKTGIHNLIKYFPTIWNDRDFDQYFLYEIIAKKLEYMEKFFLSDGAYSSKAKEEAHKLMIAKNLARRLANDNYLSNALIDYHKIYGDSNLFGSEPVPNKPHLSRLIHVGTKQQHDMFGRCGKHSDKLRQQDREMLFDLMKKNIEGWWD